MHNFHEAHLSTLSHSLIRMCREKKEAVLAERKAIMEAIRETSMAEDFETKPEGETNE